MIPNTETVVLGAQFKMGKCMALTIYAVVGINKQAMDIEKEFGSKLYK